MKISKERQTAIVEPPEDKVFCLVSMPVAVHGKVKAEAALRRQRISEVVVEAVNYWLQSLN